MVEMARAHDLNIYGYLKYLLEQRPSEEMTDEQLSELAPWSKKQPHKEADDVMIVDYDNQEIISTHSLTRRLTAISDKNIFIQN